MSTIQKDPVMDSLTDSMSNLKLKNSVCAICKGGVEEIFLSPCSKNCKIICHTGCMHHWIGYKRWKSHCIVCMESYDLMYIDNILFNNEMRHYRF